MTTPDQRSTVPVAAADGHRFELIVHRPPDAVHGLVMVPAMGVAARHYEPFAHALAVRGIACAVHEWRGNGSSDRRAGRRSDWGYHELLDLDLVAAFDALVAAQPDIAWRLGGHSLGAQFAALLAAQDARARGIAIIAGGTPYWRSFPHVQKLLLHGVFGFMNTLAAVNGRFPGRTTGFAGNEARGVIRDWTATGRTGHYRVRGLARDYEGALSACSLPVLALRMADDRYVPRASLVHLLEKLPQAKITRFELGRADFSGARADHFAWMKRPAAVADRVSAWCHVPPTREEPDAF